jgi:hypothetical protein
MIFDTPGDVIQAVSDRQADMRLLRTRFEADYDLINLVPYEPERKGYNAYTSPAPRNFFDKVGDGLNRAELQIAINLPESADQESKDEASTGELLLFGALNDIDRRLRNIGEPRFRSSSGWYVRARGWLGIRCLVYIPDGEENVVFDAMPWDPLHMTWETGTNGLLWGAYTTWVSPASIEDEWDVKIETNEKLVRKIDIFDKTDNAVIVQEDWIKEPRPHGLDHTPVFIGSVGSMPTVSRDADVSQSGSIGSDPNSTFEAMGDSVFQSVREIYEPRNKHVSRLMDMHERAMVGSLVHESEDGFEEIKGDPFRFWRAIKIRFGKEKIYPLQVPSPPESTGALLGIFDRDIEMSTLPYPLAYGGINDPMSGRALAILTDATRSIYNPRTDLLANGYLWLCEEILSQYATKIDKPSTISGFQGFEHDAPFFSTQIKPSSIDKAWMVSVSVEPRLPRDQESEILMSLQATTRRDGQQLLSNETARADIMKIRDPHSEEQKVLAEMGRSHPAVMQAQLVAALREQGDDDAADVVEKLGQQAQAGQPPGGPQQGGPEGQNGAAPPIPPEAQQMIVAVLGILEQAGQEELAEAFMRAVEARQKLPVEVAVQIARILIEAGREDVARAFAQAFAPPTQAGPQVGPQVGPQGGPQGVPQGGPPGGPPVQPR